MDGHGFKTIMQVCNFSIKKEQKEVMGRLRLWLIDIDIDIKTDKFIESLKK